MIKRPVPQPVCACGSLRVGKQCVGDSDEVGDRGGPNILAPESVTKHIATNAMVIGHHHYHHRFNITISTESVAPKSSTSVIGHIVSTMAHVIHTIASKRIAITKISRISH